MIPLKVLMKQGFTLMTEFYTIDELSEMLKLHRNTVARWFNEGVFPNAIEFKGTKRVPASDLEAMKPFKKEAG